MHGHYGITAQSKTNSRTLGKLLIGALEHEATDKAWEMWKSLFPLMVSGLMKFIDFNEYKTKIFKREKRYTEISNDAIEQEISALVRR